jgi:hypothetical protein
MLFALALGALHFFAAWVSSMAMVGAALLLALSGLARYILAPPGGYGRGPGEADAAVSAQAHRLAPGAELLPMEHFRSTESWALAGWSGCLHLASSWHRRHLDWGLGLLMFFAATAAVFSGG